MQVSKDISDISPVKAAYSDSTQYTHGLGGILENNNERRHSKK